MSLDLTSTKVCIQFNQNIFLFFFNFHPISSSKRVALAYYTSIAYRHGFVCTHNVPDPYGTDGCSKRCGENEVLVPNFAAKSWVCEDNTDRDHACPGAFHVECPTDPVVPEASSCECLGQMLVDANCQNG